MTDLTSSGHTPERADQLAYSPSTPSPQARGQGGGIPAMPFRYEGTCQQPSHVLLSHSPSGLGQLSSSDESTSPYRDISDCYDFGRLNQKFIPTNLVSPAAMQVVQNEPGQSSSAQCASLLAGLSLVRPR